MPPSLRFGVIGSLKLHSCRGTATTWDGRAVGRQPPTLLASSSCESKTFRTLSSLRTPLWRDPFQGPIAFRVALGWPVVGNCMLLKP
eukprot:2056873-Alexandrium_andersonii.AAC.1